MMQRLALPILLVLAAMAFRARAADADKAPHWLEPMRKLNARFKGTDRYIARFGDSITLSRAFWSPLGWSDPDIYIPDDGLPKRPQGKPWKQTLGGINDEDGCGSGWTTENVLTVIDKVLERRKPEMAIIMIGTNDIAGGKVPKEYRSRLEKIVAKCLDAQCIPILNTIPPRKGLDKAVSEVNGIIEDVATKHHIPLVDYHEAIVMRQPDGRWLGSLIDKDGVHPTAGKTEDYSSKNLEVSGYALRTWVNFMMVREVYFKVLEPPQ
jgi:lysophospholipase L1-like esterase